MAAISCKLPTWTEYAEAKAEVKQKLGKALDQIEKLAD